MNTRTVSHYRILEKLGAGGMGEVYLAEDIRLARKVALKFLLTELCSDEVRIRRFMQEARAASALNHPNIITVYDIGEDESGHFIAMEHIEGRTLRELLNQRVSLNSLAVIGRQIAKALAVAHAVGIVHRDIKPDNVMVRDDGYVKVLDFGLARLASPLKASSVETAFETDPGLILGTAAYMSPEQASGKSIGSATDLFSLGIVLYELATSKHPFHAQTSIGFLHAILSEEVIAPSRLNPEIPPSLERLILQMLKKDSQLRPSAVEVEAALAQWDRIVDLDSYDTSILTSSTARPGAPPLPSISKFTVGRDAEHARLQDAFASAAASRGSMICIAGEPGIGKTTLVEEFLAELTVSGVRSNIARGRCSERMAGNEAYLPLLEALESLLRGEGSSAVARLFEAVAPTWYIQVAPQVNESAARRLNEEARSATQQQMKRQLATLLGDLSQQRPLVLFFDDFQWADLSTVDLIAYIATRLEGMRLLIVITYRPSEMVLSKHPFLQVKLDLQGRGLCHEIPLGLLDPKHIGSFLELEFPGHDFPREFVELVYEKTEGNPLFMVDLLRYLRDREALRQKEGRWILAQLAPDLAHDLPESVRSMIERKLDQLDDVDRRLLMCASVQGYEFDSAVVSKAMGFDSADVEERLEVLERAHALVKVTGEREFPDRTLTLRYRFVHALYQNALYGSLKPTRKASLSAAVAEALRGYYGAEKWSEVASELALLFETARDFDRASSCFITAAKHALSVFAYQEAAALSLRGVELILKMPETPERDQRELDARMTLGVALAPIKGYAAPEVERAFSRARELCQQFGESPELFRVLYGLWTVSMLRANFPTALNLSDRLVRLAQKAGQPRLSVRALYARGFTSDYLGDHQLAREYYEQVLALADPDYYLQDARTYGEDGTLITQARMVWVMWVLGYPDQAADIADKCVERARLMVHPFSSAAALLTIPQLSFDFRLPRRGQEMAEEAMAISTEYGFPLILAYAAMHRGWAIGLQGRVDEGLDEMHKHLVALSAMGAEMSHSGFHVMMGDVYREAGRAAEGLATVAEGLDKVERSGERFFEAELYRARGDLMAAMIEAGGQDAGLVNGPLWTPDHDEAEASFLRAINIAQQRGAKSHELRAAISLSRLMPKQGKGDDARKMLVELLNWFSEGFDTYDLKTARALITELA